MYVDIYTSSRLTLIEKLGPKVKALTPLMYKYRIRKRLALTWIPFLNYTSENEANAKQTVKCG